MADLGREFYETGIAHMKNEQKANDMREYGAHVEGQVRTAEDFLLWQMRANEAKAKMSKANDRQEGGTHYRTKAIQPWDYIAANGLGYFEGNVVKYVTRYAEKNGLSDLRKARHYLDKLIEIEEAKIVGNG